MKEMRTFLKLKLPLIPGITRAPDLVGYFPLKPTGISGVFNNSESSAERQNKIISQIGNDSSPVESHKVQ